MEEITIFPTFPSPDIPDELIWPISNRNFLLEVSSKDASLCQSLIGQQGLSDGSGKSDALIFLANGWCLKTSLRRHFLDVNQAQGALARLTKGKQGLGKLLPPKTTLILQPSNNGAFWLWTLTPWLKTLRSLMIEAVDLNYEPLLAAALQAFARVSVESLLLASRQNFSLDVHPSNFALTHYQQQTNNTKINISNYEEVVYLDDDISEKTDALTVGYALLKRIDEYQNWQKALELYIMTLEDAMLSNLQKKDVEKLHLLSAFEHLPLRSDLAQEFAKRIVSVLKQNWITLL